MAVTKPVEYAVDCANDYTFMVKGVLPAMGYLPESGGVPGLAEVQDAMARMEGLTDFLLERAKGGARDGLIVSRTVGGEYGIGVRQTLKGLDALSRRDPFAGHFVAEGLWGDANGNNNPYGDRAVVHDNADNAGPDGLQSKWDVAILLDGAARKQHDRGLRFRGLTVAEQRNALSEEALQVHEQHGVTIISAALGTMVTYYATITQRFGQGRVSGPTRFVHYPDMAVRPYDFGDEATSEYVPSIRVCGGLVCAAAKVNGSAANDDGSGGLWQMVRIPLPAAS